MGSELKSLGKSIHFLIVDINAPRSALQPGKEFDAGGHQIIDPDGKIRETGIMEIPGGKVGDVIQGLANAAQGISDKINDSYTYITSFLEKQELEGPNF